MFAATDNMLKNNCLTRNGQYGFQSARTIRGDELQAAPTPLVENNEISYNDTCDLSAAQQRSPRLEEPQPRTRTIPRSPVRRGQG